MLQCRIQGRGTGNACEWEALTQGTQNLRGKRQNFVAFVVCLLCCSTSAAISARIMCLELRGEVHFNTKLKWSHVVAWLKFGKMSLSMTYTFFFCRDLAPSCDLRLTPELQGHTSRLPVISDSHQSCGVNYQGPWILEGADWCRASACFICRHVKRTFLPALFVDMWREHFQRNFQIQNGEVVGEMCTIQGHWPLFALFGCGGGLHGDNRADIYVLHTIQVIFGMARRTCKGGKSQDTSVTVSANIGSSQSQMQNFKTTF